MELDKIIQSRHSIRKYDDKQIPYEYLTLLLESARYAPSSGNLQDFRFVVIDDIDKKNKIAEASLNQYWMNSAPIFIVVCSDSNRLKTYYKNNYEKYSMQNSAVAAILISLKSVDLGLGSCWVDVFEPNKVAKILGIQDGVVPQIILTIGYPIYPFTEPQKTLQKISLKRITFFNKYGDRNIDLGKWGEKKYKEIIKEFLKKIFKK